MRLDEMFDKAPIGYANEKEDNSSLKLNDLRKTKLTLRQIKRMRIMNDIRKLELAKKVKKVQTQYGASAAQGGELGGLGI
jgi:hypothetical protein